MCLAIPGKIVEISSGIGIRMCKVDFGGVIREVCIETIPEANIGDYVIVHAGFALSLLNEAEAKETLELINEIALLSEDENRTSPNTGLESQ
ncbi:MAG: HypC/HybG/HupF family hydrogenase formation chaperone [Anaerolineaceae bacterium]|nr:HypC/HybG/HupF family hydrogenase formation chaperone [Anaerolineaceae bacterium]